MQEQNERKGPQVSPEFAIGTIFTDLEKIRLHLYWCLEEFEFLN